MLFQKNLSRKISPEKSLDFWSRKSVLRPALRRSQDRFLRPKIQGRTPETPLRLPLRPAPRAWAQRPPRARACLLGPHKRCEVAKKVHKYRTSAPGRARMAGNSGKHLFVWVILTSERMVSRAHSPPLATMLLRRLVPATDFEKFFSLILKYQLLCPQTTLVRKIGSQKNLNTTLNHVFIANAPSILNRFFCALFRKSCLLQRFAP